MHFFMSRDHVKKVVTVVTRLQPRHCLGKMGNQQVTSYRRFGYHISILLMIAPNRAYRRIGSQKSEMHGNLYIWNEAPREASLWLTRFTSR